MYMYVHVAQVTPSCCIIVGWLSPEFY